MWEKFGARKQAKRPESELTQEGRDRREFLKHSAISVGKSVALGTLLGGVVGEGFSRLIDFKTWSSDRTRRMRFERFGSLSAQEREKIIKAEVQQAGSFMKSSEGKRILENGTDDEIFTLLTSMPPLLREHIAGTSYDIQKEKWPSVAVGVAHKNGEPYALGINYGPTTIKQLQRGNGVFVAPDMLLTNWHVIAKQSEQNLASSELPSLHEVLLQKLYESQNIDAVYIRFSKPVTLESPTSFPNIFPLSHEHLDADVSGNLVTVAGIDPDRSAASDGTKIYPSIAIPVTSRLRAFLEQYAETAGEVIENGFMYIAPPGESAPRPYPSESGSRFLDVLRGRDQTARARLMQGTSGSLVLMDGKLVGLNHRLGNIEYKGVGLDVGFFHGPDALRKGRESGMETIVPKTARKYSPLYRDDVR